MIDNYDSFTYNLFQYFGKLGAETVVLRNDKTSLKEIQRLKPDRIAISPGPKRPSESGISKQVIAYFAGKIPVLGICLGHQCIGEIFGAKVVKAKEVKHGKTSLIYHDGSSLYRGIENPFIAARYHSLVVEDIPSCLTLTAWTQDNIVMGLRHREYDVEGIQFHPESFMTERGMDIIRNFLRKN